MSEDKDNILRPDDEVILIGGSEWNPDQNRPSRKDGKWKIAAISLAAVLIAVLGIFIVRHIIHHNEFIQSRSADEILNCLKTPMSGEAGIKAGAEEAMGVQLRTYELSGLKAHFADTVPDYRDSSIYLITRSSDHKLINNKKEIIGDFIIEGEELAKSNWRAGFMIMENGNAQIGVSRSSKIFKHAIETKGSMFRQFALVSGGVKCSKQFELKGKVTRCAYAIRDDKLYFIETVNPETMHGFSDALVELGFIDAIYITGGSQPDLFYRKEDGTSHGEYIDPKPHDLIVWTK